MSIRQQRQDLANLRALEEETERETLHGRGGVPSMGVSQMRGGAVGGKRHRRKKHQYYDEDEDDMEGGFIGALAGLAARLIPTIARGATTAARVGSTAARGALSGVRGAVRSVKPKPAAPKPTSTAIVPYNPATAAARTGTQITTKPAGAITNRFAPKPLGGPRLNVGDTTKPATTMGSRLGTVASRLGTVANVALPVGMAVDYFTSKPSASGATTDTGYYEDYAGDMGAMDTGMDSGYTEGMLPTGRSAPAPQIVPMGTATGSRSRYGNIQSRAANLVGSGKEDGRKARAAVVRKVMREKGMSLPEASRYVKQHGLY